MRGPRACPQVEGLVGPLLVPVGWESRLALRVQNLQHFQVSIPAGGGWGAANGIQAADGIHPPGLACLLPLLAGAARTTAEAASIPGGGGWGLEPHSLPGPAGGQVPDPHQSHLPLDISCSLGLSWALGGLLAPFSPLSLTRPALGRPWLGDGLCTGGMVIYAGKSFPEEAGGGLGRF